MVRRGATCYVVLKSCSHLVVAKDTERGKAEAQNLIDGIGFRPGTCYRNGPFHAIDLLDHNGKA